MIQGSVDLPSAVSRQDRRPPRLRQPRVLREIGPSLACEIELRRIIAPVLREAASLLRERGLPAAREVSVLVGDVGEFEETKHPRGQGGKFSDKPGGGDPTAQGRWWLGRKRQAPGETIRQLRTEVSAGDLKRMKDALWEKMYSLSLTDKGFKKHEKMIANMIAVVNLNERNQDSENHKFAYLLDEVGNLVAAGSLENHSEGARIRSISSTEPGAELVVADSLATQASAAGMSPDLSHRQNALLGVIDALTVYHGTSSEVEDAIKSEGLKVGLKTGGYKFAEGVALMDVVGKDDKRKGSAFVTTDRDRAMTYGNYASQVMGGTPVVFEIAIPSDKLKGFQADPKEGEGALRTTKPIPPEWIRSVVKDTTDGSLFAAVLVTRVSTDQQDAPSTDLGWFVELLRRRLGARVDGLSGAVLAALQGEEARHRRAFQGAVRASFGIDLSPVMAQSDVREQVTLASERSMTAIRGMTDDLARRTSQTLIEGVVRGRRARAIAGDLAEDLGISQRRARLIARNETATLNGTLNRVRQQQAGVKRYVWSTSLDERVRPLHQEREGRTYSWDDPPSDGHPGEPINCRCVARAVIGSTLSRDSLTRDAFEEAKHPRGAHGRFGEKPDQSSTHVPWWLGQRKAKREWAQTDPKTFSTAFGDRELRIKQYGSSSWSVSLDGNRIGDIPKATRAKAMLTALQMAEDHVAAQHAPTPKPKLTKSQREEKARQVAASPVPDKEAVAELYDYLNVPSVNGSLRMGKALTDEERDQVAGLDRLMMPIGEGKTLWRWVHARHDDARVVNKLRDGQAVQDLAYVSTSKMSEADFLGQFVPAQEGETWLETAYVMEIKGHPGLRGIDANQVLPDHRFASQREILLERGLVLERIAERKAIIGNGKTVRVITFRTSSRGTKIADASFSATDAAFEEAKHPRGAHGRFGEKPDAGQWWLGQRKPAITRIRELEAEGRLKFALYADEKRTMADLIGDRVSPDSFLKMMGAPTGEVHVPTERAGFLKLRHENDAYNWERTFDVRSRVVTHDVFRVNNQGAGTAKRVLRDQVALYRELGVKRIELDAVSLGSYAWAKYGFRPDEASWRAMRPQIRNRLSEVSDEVRPLVEKVVESQDPRAVWALSDLPGKLGLSLLRDLPWSGSLDLSDERAMRRFYDYVSR